MEFFQIVLLILVALGILIFSISFHESAHAFMADRLGDPTAKYLGRISLNPAVHIDPLGTIIFPLFFLLTTRSFLGWAKPTPFNPWNLKNPKRDAALISLAGPASNLLLAIVLAVPFRLGLAFVDPTLVAVHPSSFFAFSPILKLSFLISAALVLNILLAIFNLLPIHPLDGAKVIGGILPKDLYYQWASLERYGVLILLAVLIFFGDTISAIILNIVSFILNILI